MAQLDPRLPLEAHKQNTPRCVVFTHNMAWCFFPYFTKGPRVNITLTNHPAQARHPLTKQPLFEADGVTPVPLFPERRCIRLDGVSIGECHSQPGHPIGLTQAMDEYTKQQIIEFVEREVGRVTSMNTPPDPTTLSTYLENEDDDNFDTDD